MVYPQGLVLEENEHENGKYCKGNRLLDHFQLPQVEWASVFDKAYPVGGHLAAILEQGDAPAEEDHQRQAEFRKPGHALQFQVAIPRQSHEHIRAE